MGLDSIELRHMRFFVALAEERSFGRAAARCHITQPPFSVAIQQLESHLDVMLVDRSSRQVALTPAGMNFYRECLRVLANASGAFHLAQSTQAGGTGRIRVGFFASMIMRGLGQVVAAMERAEPRLDIELHEMSSNDQVRALLAGHLDVGFAHAMVAPRPLLVKSLYSEPFVACLPASHRLASEKAIDLSALKGEPFVIFSRPAAPGYYDRILAICVEAGFTPNLRHQVRQWLTVVAMVANGMGVALVPKCLSSSRLAGAAFVALNQSAAHVSIQCMWQSRDPDPHVMNFVRLSDRLIGERSLIVD